MPKSCTKLGNDFRKKFNYYGKLTKDCMGPKLWNEYYKFLSKRKASSVEYKKEATERKIARKAAAEEKAKLREAMRRLNGEQYKKYCKTPELIENFYEAQKDNFKNWILHHKLEQMFTASELITMNIYYDCKPGELMFMKVNEHNGNARLHYGIRKRDKTKCGRHKK